MITGTNQRRIYVPDIEINIHDSALLNLLNHDYLGVTLKYTLSWVHTHKVRYKLVEEVGYSVTYGAVFQMKCWELFINMCTANRKILVFVEKKCLSTHWELEPLGANWSHLALLTEPLSHWGHTRGASGWWLRSSYLGLCLGRAAFCRFGWPRYFSGDCCSPFLVLWSCSFLSNDQSLSDVLQWLVLPGLLLWCLP